MDSSGPTPVPASKGGRRKRKAPGKKNQKENADQLLNDAIKVAENGDLDEALSLFHEIAAMSPQNGRSWENLAVRLARA